MRKRPQRSTSDSFSNFAKSALPVTREIKAAARMIATTLHAATGEDGARPRSSKRLNRMQAMTVTANPARELDNSKPPNKRNDAAKQNRRVAVNHTSAGELSSTVCPSVRPVL